MKILAHCNISPPPNSAPPTSLPLTFLDIPWLLFSPTQPLFFYQYSHPTSHFLSTTLPTLVHSLSLTLHHFFPFAGNLVLSPGPGPTYKPVIAYDQGDSVSITVADADSSNAHHFIGDHQRCAKEFHALLPELSCVSEEKQGIPLFAAKVTIFPNNGVCIGLAYHHVVADGRTFNNFIKTWASLHQDSSSSIQSPPFYDRTVIKDTHGLESILFKEWCARRQSSNSIANADLSDMVRATFVMSPTDMEKIKQWIIGRCKEKKRPQPTHLSPYNVACSFTWVCLTRAQEKFSGDDPIYLGFNAGGITRLGYPDSYFGNCVGFGRCMAVGSELLGEDGIIVAASVIGNKIKELNKAVLGGAENWISDWAVFPGSKLHIMVVGSPKLDFYETDFGWGRPKKIEEISIDNGIGNAISLTESRDFKGGIEVGLALTKAKMDAFASGFIQNLKLMT